MGLYPSCRRLLLGMACASLLLPGAAHSQPHDPAAIEDAAIERQRLLRAVDQMEILAEQVSILQARLQELQKKTSGLEEQNQTLRSELKASKEQEKKAREALLSEVASTIEKATKAWNQKFEELAQTPGLEPVKPSPEKPEKGYTHIVKKGQSLWAIAQAFKKNGVNVSVDDIAKANNMGRNDPLHVGDELFIPHKD